MLEKSWMNGSRHSLTSICSLFLHECCFDWLGLFPNISAVQRSQTNLCPDFIQHFVHKTWTRSATHELNNDVIIKHVHSNPLPPRIKAPSATAWTKSLGNLQINPITTLKSKMSHYFISSLYPSTLSTFSPILLCSDTGNPFSPGCLDSVSSVQCDYLTRNSITYSF